MSDWKTRSTPVAEAPSTNDWKSRSASADPAQPSVAAIGSPDGPTPLRSAANAVEGFGSGASLGYLPQMSGALEEAGKQVGSVKDKALDAVGLGKLASQDFNLRKEGFNVPDLDGYTAGRDAMVRRLDAAQQENPWIYGTGAVAGGVASAAAPGLAASKLLASGQLLRLGTVGKLAQAIAQATGKAGSGGKLLQAMGAGKAYGALANPGDKPGVIDPLQMDQRGENAETGALLGAAGHAAGPAIEAGGNTLYNGALNKLTAAIGRKGKGGITNDLFEGGITNPKDLAAKTKDLLTQHVQARDYIAQQADAAGAEMNVHNSLEEAENFYNEMKMKAGRDPDALEELTLARERLDRLKQNAAQEKFTPNAPETTYDAPTMGKIDRAGTMDPVVPNKFSQTGQMQKGISQVRPVINDAIDEVGALPVAGTHERLPGPNATQARALTSRAQGNAGNANYKEFAKTDNGAKLEKAIASGFQKGNEASIAKVLGPEAAEQYAGHNATIGRIADSSKAAETVSDQTARDISNLTSLPKTDGMIGTLVGSTVGAASHDPITALTSAIAAVGGQKVMRGINLSQMPVGYAMKKAGPVIAKEMEKNPWLVQGMLNNQIGGPNGEK